MNKIGAKVVAMSLVLAMVFAMLPGMATPAMAATAGARDEWIAATAGARYECRIVYLDAEIQVIDGHPVIVVETEEGYVHVPFALFGSPAVGSDGTYLLIPVEDGMERVCINEFEVKIVDGQLILVYQTNPIWKVAAKIAAGTVAGAWNAHWDGRCAWAGAAKGAAAGTASTIAMAKTAGTWVATAIGVGYGGHIAAKLASPRF